MAAWIYKISLPVLKKYLKKIYHRCYGYMINRAFHTKKLFK